ncbi:prolyl oligopeptidase family serine peptidase [Geodermatophilus sp. YIM 151500]|uniref:S9 family peptidase n=1 Tax=Geodermatophilus sp. YIM 151500 TaxID=2984531 RepID=UPI0021E42FC8|nr:prolyl oligopeptidase family serine peptidase [Geodermatophilus sp. YIM 151500]MCV2489636.1 prolyl oligopeptidase family serine peptidase [Geodermatophilus sp. YIM 151500]
MTGPLAVTAPAANAPRTAVDAGTAAASLATAPPVDLRPGLSDGLPGGVRAAIADVATAPGAWCPALSPAGDRIAYVTDRSGTPRLEVAPLDGSAPPAVVSTPGQEVVSVAWSPDGAELAYLVSPGGSIRAELHAVRPDGGAPRLLAGGDPRATVFAGGWTAPGRYACSIADGTSPDADVVLVDVDGGELRTLARGGFLSVTAVSADERTLLARRGPRGHRHVVLVDVATGAQRRVLPLGAPGGVASEDGRFGPDGRSVYLRASLPGPPFADRAGLVVVPLDADGAPGAGRVLLSRPDADLDGYAVRPDGTVLAVWTVDGVTELALHDGATGALLREVALPEPVLPGWSLAADGATLVAELTGPKAPRALWRVPLAGRGRPAPVPLGLRRPDPAPLVEPVRCTYAGADGLPLAGWLYRPPDVHGPARTVVSFHGGPEGQERPAWSPVAQSLVAAGLTVFAPDVRGSGGYGRAFVSADDGPAREASFADVPATVAALVTAGVAEPGRIGAHGWSYGGYLTLVALTRWPGLFAAGATLAGMSDLRTFFAGTEPWMAAASVTEYGDPVADGELLARLSPMTALDRVTAPVLLAHGDRDTNVPVGESVQAHGSLTARGAVAELLLLPGEGHTIVGHPHVVELSERVAAWFDTWL